MWAAAEQQVTQQWDPCIYVTTTFSALSIALTSAGGRDASLPATCAVVHVSGMCGRRWIVTAAI